MRFRTEIEAFKGSFSITHSSKIVLLGSCFADNIGELLVRDGFDAVHNPLGPLFNPESVMRVLSRNAPYGSDDFIEFNGTYHCLDFANRYQDSDTHLLAEKVNADFLHLKKSLKNADVLIITLGTSRVFRHLGTTVGNCHKLPGYMFSEHNLTISEIERLSGTFGTKNTILTLSPVRYPGEGLAKGFLAKATLRVAIDNICRTTGSDYFPAFEIVNDDLRDYRFYAPDMRHPSEVAIQYIYEKFAHAYFSDETSRLAAENRKIALQAAHRPILSDR